MASRYNLFKQAEEAQKLVDEVAATEKLNDIDKDKKIEELQKQINDLSMQVSELKKPLVAQETKTEGEETSQTVKESQVELDDEFRLGVPENSRLSGSVNANPLREYLHEKYQ